MTRGGNRGGGTTIRRLTISEEAARHLRLLATGQYGGTRYTKAQADAAASRLIESHAAKQLLFVPPADAPALLAWLTEQRQEMAPDHPAMRGVEQIIAALWVEAIQE